MFRRGCLVTLLYLALTFLFAYPLPLHVASQLFATGSDPQLWMWTLAWDAHAFLHQPLAIFDANTFYPAHHALAYSENLIGSALFAAPVIWLTDNPVLALNLVELMSAFCCALGGYVLGRRVGLRPASAVLTGMVFGFAPSRFLRIDQFHLTTIQWVPFGLAFLHSYLQDGRKSDLRAFVAFLSLQTLTSGHGAAFLLVASTLLVLYRLAQGEPIAPAKRLRDLGIPGALLLLPAGVLFLAYHAAQAEVPELHRQLDDFSVSTASYFASSAHLQTWILAHAPAWFTTPEADTELFPGYLPVLLAVLALTIGVSDRRQRQLARAQPWWARAALGIELVALASIVLASALTLSGQNRLKLGTTVLFTARHMGRLWMLAAMAVIARIAMATRAPFNVIERLRWPFIAVAQWWRGHRRDIAMFYLLLTLVSFWLTLGPPIGLWRWVYWLPVLNFLRVPSRFVVLEMLGLAVLAGIGFDRVSARWTTVARGVGATIVAGLLVAEFAAMPLGTEPFRVDLPAIDRWLNTQQKPFAIAEVPLPRSPSVAVIAEWNTIYMLHSTAHWQKTVHGFSGVEPPFYTRLYRQLTRFPDDESVHALADLGVKYVVMHTNLYRGNELSDVERRLEIYKDWLTLDHVEGDGRAYVVHKPGS